MIKFGLALLLFLVIALPTLADKSVASQPDGVGALSVCKVSVESGPIVLHDRLRVQWGGHTFGYLLEGERGVFWTGALYNPADGSRTSRPVIGQYPLPRSKLPIRTNEINITDPDYEACNHPQILRTPDGYIHVFIGVTYRTSDASIHPSQLKYYRSAKPEDISVLIDRTSLIPTTPYDCFHLRMNVGVTPDGKRMALVVLAWSPAKPNQLFPFNTPVVFLGSRKGLDFTFKNPVKYAEAQAFFYPQVAASNAGIVLVGQNWDNQKRVGVRLMQMNWSGKVVHQEDLPMPVDGYYYPCDLRPEANASGKLILYCAKGPLDKTDCTHDFYRYDPQSWKLTLLGSVQTDYSRSNPGRLALQPDGQAVLINSPSMGGLYSWEGGLLENKSGRYRPIEGADVMKLGYAFSSYVFIPNPIYGSVSHPGGFYVGSDCGNAGIKGGDPGPVSFLLWRMKRAE